MKKQKIIYANIIFNILLLLLMVNIPFNASALYRRNYLLDAGCLLMIAILYMRYVLTEDAGAFDPLGIITIIYSFLYYVAPMYDIVLENYTWFGYGLFKYGMKASLIALGGYIAFYLFYCGKFRREENVRRERGEPVKGEPDGGKLQRVMPGIILLMYAVSFAANVFYLIHSGYSNVLYIMTLGILGSGRKIAENMDSIGFVAMVSYSLPTIVLLYWEYTRKTLITILLFIPMLMMQVTRGFRFLVVQIAISFVAYYFISRRKKLKIWHVLIVGCVLMIPVLLMTMFRNDIRAGLGVSFSGINMQDISEAIDDAIWDNFRIYNNFYGMVHMIPKRYGYVYGRQILIGTLVMGIPRAVWPGKISTQAGVDLSYIVGARLAKTGQAYPGLGEYYYALGIPGVLIFMAIYGIWARHIKNRYGKEQENGLDVIIFSVLLGVNLQLLIRGYTPSNVWYIIFSLFPVYVVKMLDTGFIKKGW